MKKRLGSMKIISGIISLLSISLVVLWLSLPRFLETAIEEILVRLDGKLQSITIEKANPWSIEMSDLSGFTKEGNFSLKKVDVRYDPVQVAEGKVHALSVSSPKLSLDVNQLTELLGSADPLDENGQSLQKKAQEFLLNPPLQHFRVRDAEVSLLGGDDRITTKLGMEGDFHTGLAQLRVDTNSSGFSWLGDVTMVEEGSDLFLGASLYFPDLSSLPNLLDSLSLFNPNLAELDLTEWIQIEQGAARGQWTGRVEEDGVIDQFMDFNATDLVMQCMGMTFDIPQAILFLTPRTPNLIESNFYANLNWGENLRMSGLKISANLEDGLPKVTTRIQRLQTGGLLPQAEILGLLIDEVEFAYGENDELLGIRNAKLRFSAIHLEEGMYNLYDGEIQVEWMGEDRFRIELLKANGSVPTIGLNLHKIGFSGEVVLGDLPKLETEQTFTIEEAFLGEDQKIEDFKVQFRLDSADRIELSEISLSVNDFKLNLDPANLIIEKPEPSSDCFDISFLEGELQFPDYEDFSIRNLQGNVKLNNIDPLESNGSQQIRFDFHAGEQVLEDGKINFNLLPTGEKMIHTVEINAFGGLLSLEETTLEDNFDNFELKALASGLNSQDLIALFEDLDARMEGNLSGLITIRNDPFRGWDFYGGSLSLDSSDSAKLYLNTHGMLTEGLEPKSSEYKNMYLLERALQDLQLDGLSVLFKVLEDGERVVEMNVRGESEVDGKGISVEYRPKIVGGLEALMQQADLSKWGFTP
jgi:hypothetical protein